MDGEKPPLLFVYFSHDIDTWFVLSRYSVIQPSSASAERVFSLLTNAFGSQQESALQDYLEASVMPRYNNAKRV